MALSLDPATKTITIPQADLALVTGSLYELDTNAFRKAVTDLLSSEPYIWMDDAYSHNTEVTVAGTTFARTLEFINGYSVEFESASYSVRLAGSNNNIFDVENGILVQNLVQVIAQNSAGLVVVSDGGGGATADEVWEALVATYTGSTDEMGGFIIEQLQWIRDNLEPFLDVVTPLLGLMAVTYSTFIASFPEFDQVDQTLIETKIAEASAMLDPDGFGDVLINLAVSYRVAHLLAISPYGKQLQLINDDGDTVYNKLFTEHILPLCGRRSMVL